MPVYETGHARNVQRFEELISFITSWGSDYQPSNAEIELTKLTNKLTDANTSLDGVTSSLTDFKGSVNDRENTFDGIRKLVTRVVNFYESTGAAENDVDDAKSIKRKIDGKRADTSVEDPPGEGEEGAETISVSQQSYTQITEFFEQLISLLDADSLYDPNENDLKITTLQTRHAAMQAANTDVINKKTAISNARFARNDVMYADETGLVDKALLVKKYVKAAFGTDSSQFLQIKGLEFRRPSE